MNISDFEEQPVIPDNPVQIPEYSQKVPDEIKDAFSELKEASEMGDWIKFGEALLKLDNLINPERITENETRSADQ